MSPKAFSAVASIVASAVVTALVYPFAAPLIASATKGAVFDFAGYFIALSPSMIPEFWTSADLGSHAAPIAACFCALSIVLFAYRNVKQAESERRVDGGVYGDARIVRSRSELNRKNDRWNGRGVPKSAGLVLGATKDGYWFDSSVPHALTVGKTGSGKSQLQVLETMHLLMAAGWNVIATGKPEVLELTGDKARELGYGVVVLDLNGYPGASSYNPLELVVDAVDRNDRDSAVRIARQVAVDLVPLGGEKNTYFPKAARSALTAAILVVCTADIPNEQKNLSSVAAVIQRGTAGDDPKDPSGPLKDYIRNLGPEHVAYAPASDFLSDGGVTTAGKNVLSTLKEAIGIFSDASLRALTSVSDIGMRDLLERKTVVYIEMLDEGHPYSTVYTCFLNQWWSVAQEVAKMNGGRVPYETAIVGDEIGNTGKVSCLPSIATLGRSMGVHEYLFVQNLKQLNAYNEPGDGGAGRDKLLGSIGTKVALSLSEPDDFKFFTALVGKSTVRSMGTSSQKSAGRTSSSTSYSETAVPIVNEWEWQNRAPIRDGLIAVKGGENSNPGREGVFEFPVDYANRTPAGEFFGLGDVEFERRKRAEFYARALESASDRRATPDAWCPDFDAVSGPSVIDGDGMRPSEVDRDEWEAWG